MNPDDRFTRQEWILIGVNALYIVGFSLYALIQENVEFLMYAGVMVVIMGILIWNLKKVPLSHFVYWCLTVWGILHLGGGTIHVGDGVLYGLQIVPVILRYDQLVHAYGFAICTVIGFELLKPHMIENTEGRPPIVALFLCFLIGIGFGAVNEVLEFTAVLWIPDTGVGGYMNTGYDLVFNSLGSLLAVFVIAIKYYRK